MSGHTPAPWTVDESDEYHKAICAVGWYGLATVVTRMSHDKLDDHAGLSNAQLIAAAPELLAALKDLAAIASYHRVVSTTPEYQAAWLAIEKATK